MILTAGSNTMAIDKSFVRQERGDMSRTSSIASVVQQLGFGRTPSLGRTPSFGRSGSTSSQRSSKWLSAFERMKSNPDIERTEAYFSRLGQPLHMEGSSILLRIAHPPMSLDADVLATNRSTDALQGKVAIFALHPKRMTMAAIYDCAYRAERQKAIGAIFPVKKPELFAAERYDENEMQRSFDSEDSTPAPKKLNIPIVCISELMAKSIEDCALVSVVPNTSIVRGLIADENASVRAAALRTLCAVSRRNCPKLIDVLIELIVDKREEVRRVCVEAFMNPERVCPGNPMAIEELARISENEDWRVREASMIALCKVANCNQETCDPDGEVNNPVAIQAVIARLQDTEGLVKKLAIDGLITLALADGVIDEEDLPIIETLVESQADGDPLVATACSKALAFLSGESEDVTKVFPWMCDCRPQIRSISTRTLGNARIQNNCVILSMLRKRAADDFGQVRASAAFALAQVAEPGHKAAMVTIERLLGDTDAEVRSSAIEAMKVLVAPWGPNSQDSLKLLLRLVEMVKDSDTGVRTCASDALETCAGGSVEVLQALGEVLESHADFTVRKKALESMHRLVQPGDKQMLDAITIALRDARGEVRKLGFQLLKHHYEASKAAGVDVVALKESLLDCVKDADPMVVFVTIEAIPALFDQSDRMAVMALVR
jgi:HEAT repeat protein